MKQTLTESDFVHGFHGSYADNFSFAARRAMFEFFEDVEDDCGIELEFDPVAICCEWSEYDSALSCIDECGYNFESDAEDANEKELEALEYLNDQTIVIKFDGGIVVADF